MEINKIIISFLVFALFGIAIISFGINFGDENNSDISIEDDSRISSIYSGINSTIYNYDDGDSLQETANETYSDFNAESGTVTGSISDFFMDSLLFVGKTIMGVANTILDVTFLPLLKAVGIPTEIARIVGGVISVIMLFTIVLLAWKLYRLGY
jgi:hypothetical protein